MGFPCLHSVLRLERVGKIYPTGEVLRDMTWEVKPGDRIGLVGVNGAGKSTQLRLIAGMEEASSGQIVKQGEPRIAYLQQEFDVDPSRTVREELFQAFGEAAIVLDKQKKVELEMGSDRAAADPDHLDELIHELGRLQTDLKDCMATSSMHASTNFSPLSGSNSMRQTAWFRTTPVAGKCA